MELEDNLLLSSNPSSRKWVKDSLGDVKLHNHSPNPSTLLLVNITKHLLKIYSFVTLYITKKTMIYMRQYQKLSKFWQGKNIKTSVFRTCILITQNTEQVLRISELLSVIQNSYMYGNHGNLKMELTLPVPSCYQSLHFF